MIPTIQKGEDLRTWYQGEILIGTITAAYLLWYAYKNKQAKAKAEQLEAIVTEVTSTADFSNAEYFLSDNWNTGIVLNPDPMRICLFDDHNNRIFCGPEDIMGLELEIDKYTKTRFSGTSRVSRFNSRYAHTRGSFNEETLVKKIVLTIKLHNIQTPNFPIVFLDFGRYRSINNEYEEAIDTANNWGSKMEVFANN